MLGLVLCSEGILQALKELEIKTRHLNHSYVFHDEQLGCDDSSGVYIRKSIANDLRCGNYICK